MKIDRINRNIEERISNTEINYSNQIINLNNALHSKDTLYLECKKNSERLDIMYCSLSTQNKSAKDKIQSLNYNISKIKEENKNLVVKVDYSDSILFIQGYKYISGKVVNHASKEPLGNALIRIRDKQYKHFDNNQLSSPNGDFSFWLPPNVSDIQAKISISKEGYEPFEGIIDIHSSRLDLCFELIHFE